MRIISLDTNTKYLFSNMRMIILDTKKVGLLVCKFFISREMGGLFKIRMIILYTKVIISDS